MKIVIISQCFWPDTASVAQHLNDLALELSAKGHKVTVYTSQFSYEDKSITYPKNENYNNIKITRLYHSSFGKKSIIGRAIDFISFNFSCIGPLLFLKKDTGAIIAMPPPPFLSFLALFFAKIKKIPFFYWAMDLQPELSYATGLLKEGSLIGKILNKLNLYTIKNSEKIIALDDQMKNYLIQKGGDKNKVFSSPVWQVMEKFYDGDRLSNPFRIKNNFKDKIVIMYSGNYGNAHPVDTLLEAAHDLKYENKFLFVFIGGGTQYSKVMHYRTNLGCQNIIQLPYQPRANIHISLASADFHVVVLNKKTVGFTHPNKIYGAMYVAKPIIFIGPKNSYAGKILNDNPGNLSFNETQGKELALALKKTTTKMDKYILIGKKNRAYLQKYFNADSLKKKMIKIILSE
ncbi:glycosyltransferase family 4 protein [Candidatus Marinimicrobia bacterium]|nr:glycosyltransferase family 4 protein [Candidatus Neomarinimicrobiota bacterium]